LPKPLSFLDELKRRNVFRVGIAFAITAWLIAQVAGLAADSFGAPDWVMKMIITMLVLGAPIALVMAWAYELTPQGLRRETDIEPGQSSAKTNAGRLDRMITIALILAVAYFSYDKFVLDPRRDAALLELFSQETGEDIPEDDTSVAEPPPAEQAPSIAVLPFVNMSDDSGNEYFSEGLSEELLNLLVRIPELKVAARTSSFSYKGKDTKIAQIGEELNVAHVLEGSVRKSGNQVRITAQLIKADGGFHLWSETYDRTLDDIFVTQDEIAAAVVDALKVSLLGVLPVQNAVDPQVYSYYLEGIYFNNQRDDKSLEKAQHAFENALAIDPEYVPALLGIGVTYQYRTRALHFPQEEGAALALGAVRRALEIDPDNAFAWSSLAYLKRSYEWDWEGARAAIEKALQLDPNNFDVLGAAASLSITFGDHARAIQLFRRITENDPLNLAALRALATNLLRTGEPDEALAVFRKVLALNPEYPRVHTDIARVYSVQGDFERAQAENELEPRELDRLINNAILHFRIGNEAESGAFLNEYIGKYGEEYPYPVAIIHAIRGENDLAFQWLDKAYQQRDQFLVYILGNWGLNNLHSDPRFAQFLDKMGLLEYWDGPEPAEP
jgi:TolB-like protein/Tfp pilus assembly protein PilF